MQRLPAALRATLASFTLALAALPCPAQGVALAGSMGQKALLVIDGQAFTVAAGETVMGVTLTQLNGNSAEVRRGGAIIVLQLGGAPVSLGPSARTAQTAEAVLSAGPGGHFTAIGSINGRSVQFMVDTGATFIAISQAEAQRIGIDFKNGEPAVTQTANGPIAVHIVTLSSVRLGGLELAQVRAVVVPSAMPFVLLGNSFLSRVAMRRDADVMRLELRP